MRSSNKPSYVTMPLALLAMALLGMIAPVARAAQAGGASAAPPEIAVAPGGSGTSTLTAPDFDDPRSGEQKDGEPDGPVYHWKIENKDGASPCYFVVNDENVGSEVSSTDYKSITLKAGRTTAGTSKVVVSVTAEWKTAPDTGTVPDSEPAYVKVPVKAGSMVLTASKSLSKASNQVTLTATLQGADNNTMVTFHYRDSSGNDVAFDTEPVYNGIAQVTLPNVNHNTWPGNEAVHYRFWITTNESTMFPVPAGGDGQPNDPNNSSDGPKVNETDVTWATISISRGSWKNKVLNIERPSPDNTIAFTATIVPASLHKKIRFELDNVSSEVGTNMNTGDDRGPDLTFEQQANFEVQSKKDIIESSADDNTATVTVTAHDYGAFGNITAKLDAAPDVKSDETKVLNDETPNGGNDIADAWDSQFPAPNGGSLAKSDDSDDAPTGDGHAGDYLTRYEEYRGFTVAGSYITCDPRKKDVFVHDATGYTIKDGGDPLLVWFPNTGLTVHFVDADEVGANRQINFNGGVTAQRAIFVENGGTGESPGATKGPYHDTRPSNYFFCHVNLSFFTSTVKLESGISASDSNIFYLGASDQNPITAWAPGGRVKIGAEVVDYTTGDPPGTSLDTAKTAGATVPSTATTIIVNGVPSLSGHFFQNVRINGEIIKMGTEVRNLAGLTVKDAVAAGDNTITTDATSLNGPPSGDYLYAEIGSGASKEWITYTGVDINASGDIRLTGVTRGQLGTGAQGHAAGAALKIPYQYTGCKRGQYGTAAVAIPVGKSIIPIGVLAGCTRGANGTTAGAHAANDSISVFGNDDAIRMAAAHEMGHGVHIWRHVRQNIMEKSIARGAWLGHGVFNTYKQSSQDELDAR